jgi:YVTN family beta-propeller protein
LTNLKPNANFSNYIQASSTMMLRLIFSIILGAVVSTESSANSIYVSNEKDNTITVVDTTTLEPTRTIKVGQRPRGIAVTKDGKYILVCVSDDDTIEMIDATTFERVGTLHRYGVQIRYQ